MHCSFEQFCLATGMAVVARMLEEDAGALAGPCHRSSPGKRSPKHMRRDVDEMTGRKNDREADTLDHMAMLAANMRGVRLRFKDLTKPNGLANHAKGAGRKSKAKKSMAALAALFAAARAELDDEIPF